MPLQPQMFLRLIVYCGSLFLHCVTLIKLNGVKHVVFGLILVTIPLTNGSGWYKKLKEAIEKSQMERVWMSEVKVSCLMSVFA
jgi:hypothetical protein